MSLDLISFIVLGIITLVSGYLVVASANLMHAALFLGLSFVGVAGIYLVLGAEFLAAAQILIYVGAITTLIVFGIMVSNLQDLKAGGRGVWARVVRNLASFRRGLVPLVAAAGFAILILVIYGRSLWPAEAPPASGSNLATVGRLLFTEYVVPFEIASVILLAAVLGAVALSRRDDQPPAGSTGQAVPAAERKEGR